MVLNYSGLVSQFLRPTQWLSMCTKQTTPLCVWSSTKHKTTQEPLLRHGDSRKVNKLEDKEQETRAVQCLVDDKTKGELLGSDTYKGSVLDCATDLVTRRSKQ